MKTRKFISCRVSSWSKLVKRLVVVVAGVEVVAVGVVIVAVVVVVMVVVVLWVCWHCCGSSVVCAAGGHRWGVS